MSSGGMDILYSRSNLSITEIVYLYFNVILTQGQRHSKIYRKRNDKVVKIKQDPGYYFGRSLR